jgi:hypothetical protein
LKKLLLALETPGHDLSVGEEEYKTRLKNAVTFVKTVIISCERNTIVIPNDKVGSIIGRGGVTVKDLQTRLGVTLQIPSVADVESNPPTRTITINGSPESISQAKKEIVKLLEIRRSGVIAHHLQQLIIQSHQWASVLDIALENSTAATSAASTGSVSDSCDEECMFGLVMVQDDFVETTKAGSTPSGDVKVDLPGGKRHVGECAIDAAVREFTEETGLTLNVKPGGTHSVVFDAFPDSLAISADNSLKGGTFRLFVVKQNPPSPCSQESNTVLTELLEAALILREGER